MERNNRQKHTQIGRIYKCVPCIQVPPLVRLRHIRYRLHALASTTEFCNPFVPHFVGDLPNADRAKARSGSIRVYPSYNRLSYIAKDHKIGEEALQALYSEP